MNEQITRDGSLSTSAMLQMPQQTPPIDRRAATPGRADNDTPGVEAAAWWEPLVSAASQLLR
ncbi:hypothetical protein [Streptomyces sp. NPDC057301]|uniref:hypothetical protein n=1 Tax=Streptomyces sp. NPDC057301 TaxID=3346093 RepID=UPI00362A8A94